MIDQFLISLIIVFTLIFFVWGKWRYDIVALISLFIAVFVGLIPINEMFNGFIHPIVILIISMLIISKALISSGVIDIIARYLKFNGLHFSIQLGILVLFTAIISAFVNSMGALAFMVPIAVKVARQSNVSLSIFLMPIAFASHFGGGATLIGSVSNVIVSGFRAEEIEPFGFFDFAFVSVPISLVSILFIVLIGWRLIPKREDSLNKELSFKNYITEVVISKDSPIIGKNIEEFNKFSKEYFNILNIVRDKQNIIDPSPYIVLRENDILVIETDTASLESIIITAKLETLNKKKELKEKEDIKDFETVELMVSGESSLIGESPKSLNLYYNYKINILAVNRSDDKKETRIGNIFFREGDILIIRGHISQINRFIRIFNLLSLKERDFHFDSNKRKAMLVLGIFTASIIISVINFFPIHFVFITGAMIMIAGGLIPAKDIYRSVDFSMIVMIAVMIHLGIIFYETGTAFFFAQTILLIPEIISPEIALGIVLIISILLSDILSNVSVAVLFTPVAFSIAYQLGVSPDPFLMAVAIGSGSSYLTPVGHQSNIFVMNIGNYKFTDYWKLGLPLEIITFVVGLPLIIYFWPF